MRQAHGSLSHWIRDNQGKEYHKLYAYHPIVLS